MLRSIIIRYGVHFTCIIVVFASVLMYRLGLDPSSEKKLNDYNILDEIHTYSEHSHSHSHSEYDIVSHIDGIGVVSDNLWLDHSIKRSINVRTHIPSRPRQDVIKYMVRSGDTLFGISEKYGISPETILWSNPILKDDPHLLRAEQELLISPVSGVLRVVYEGDTVEGLASVYRSDADDIVNWPSNNIDPENPQLVLGEVIVVPGGERDFVQWTVPRVARAKRNPLPAGAGPGACAGGYQGGAIGSGTFIWPAANRFLSGYNYSGYHQAIDIAAGLGAPIYASDSGVVVFAGWSNWGYGYMVVIDHGNGWQTLYSHLSQWNVSCGQSVYQGNVVGLSGSTGNSTGPHLHFEINYQGTRVNPWNYLP